VYAILYDYEEIMQAVKRNVCIWKSIDCGRSGEVLCITIPKSNAGPDYTIKVVYPLPATGTWSPRIAYRQSAMVTV